MKENESQILVIWMISQKRVQVSPDICLQLKFKLKHRIHSKRQHQQGIVVALIGEQFMWIIRDHSLLKGNKSPERSRRIFC